MEERPFGALTERIAGWWWVAGPHGPATRMPTSGSAASTMTGRTREPRLPVAAN